MISVTDFAMYVVSCRPAAGVCWPCWGEPLCFPDAVLGCLVTMGKIPQADCIRCWPCYQERCVYMSATQLHDGVTQLFLALLLNSLVAEVDEWLAVYFNGSCKHWQMFTCVCVSGVCPILLERPLCASSTPSAPCYSSPQPVLAVTAQGPHVA